MGLLGGRRALVTGGGSGIGRATCLRMAEEGSAVAVVDVDNDAAGAVVDEIAAARAAGRSGQPAALAIGADVADADALEAAFDEAQRRFGGVDTVFNNAGVGAVMPLHRYSDRRFDRIMDVNLRGTFNGIRAAVPRLRAAGGGCIVNMASVNGLRPARGEGPYSAAKAAVIALTSSAALEYGPDIRVNCVSPGFIDTPLTASVSNDEETRATLDAATPLGRAGTAAEVADVVVFLCSDLASYLTGVNVPVDGGSLLVNAQVDQMLRGVLGFFD